MHTSTTGVGSTSAHIKISTPSSAAASASLWITYINIVLYALCFQLQRPIEPFLVQQLSKNAISVDEVTRTYGRLQSFFSIIQTIGSPITGIILDRIGIKYTSAIVFAASAVSYFILSTATTNMSMLFYSKIPTLFQHAFLVAQAVAATVSVDNVHERGKALGRMTTAYTIGATIGPALGGYLTEQGGMYFAAKLAVAGSILSVLLSLIFLPSKREEQQQQLSDHPKIPIRATKSFYQEIHNSVFIGLRSNLWPLLLVKVIGGVSSSMYQTTLPIVLTQEIKINPSSLGILMSGSMFATAIFGAIAISPLIKSIGTRGMTYTGLFFRAIFGCYLAYLITTSASNMIFDNTMLISILLKNPIILLSILQGIASHSLATGLTTQTTGIVSVAEQGSLLGLEHCLFSMARIVGPPIGTSLLLNEGGGGGGFWFLSIVCGCMDVAMIVLLIGTASQITKLDSSFTMNKQTEESKRFLDDSKEEKSE